MPHLYPRGVSARLSTLGLLVASSPASCGAAGQLAESRWSLCPHHCGATGPLWGNRAGAHSSGIMGGTEKIHTSNRNKKNQTHTHASNKMMMSALSPWWVGVVYKLVGVGGVGLRLCVCVRVCVCVYKFERGGRRDRPSIIVWCSISQSAILYSHHIIYVCVRVCVWVWTK